MKVFSLLLKKGKFVFLLTRIKLSKNPFYYQDDKEELNSISQKYFANFYCNIRIVKFVA